jgi:hypothetical protein
MHKGFRKIFMPPRVECWNFSVMKFDTENPQAYFFSNIPLSIRASRTRHEHELRWYE